MHDEGSKQFPVEFVSGVVLAYMRDVAQARLGVGAPMITKAVITVPAYFTDAQKRATLDAAKIAGLQVCCAQIYFAFHRRSFH